MRVAQQVSPILRFQLLFFLCLLCPITFADVEVISHSAVTDNLDDATLISIYAMQKRVWSDGTQIIVFRLPDSHKTHQSFVQDVLHFQSYELTRLWNRLVFSGRGSAPILVSSPKEMRSKVMSTKGGIGYIDRDVIKSEMKLSEGVSNEAR